MRYIQPFLMPCLHTGLHSHVTVEQMRPTATSHRWKKTWKADKRGVTVLHRLITFLILLIWHHLTCFIHNMRKVGKICLSRKQYFTGNRLFSFFTNWLHLSPFQSHVSVLSEKRQFSYYSYRNG